MNRILLLLVLAFTQLYSEANLNDAQNEISIGKEIEYLEVKEDNLNFEAVRLPENLTRFKKSEEKLLICIFFYKSIFLNNG